MLEISRRSTVEAFRVMEVMEASASLEAEGRDIVHLEVGQPSTPAPRKAREAAAAALMSDDPMGYTLSLGLPALRERIARHHREMYGVEVPAERVVVTAGSSGAFVLAFIALLDAGDQAVIGDPGYPSYRNIFRALDVDVRRVRTSAAARYQPQASDLGDAKAMLAASPANPTGTMLGRDALAELCGACEDAGAAFISDEIYHGLDWNGRSVSALEVWDDAITVNSFSKYFAMTGWRVGWMVLPEALVRPVERLAQNMFICAPHVSQVAALAAMDATEELEANRALYARNREILLDGLPGAGFADFAPCDGAFYIYADVSGRTNDSAEFCAAMLREAGVATTPGIDFDPEEGRRWLRFSFAGSEEDMIEALRRLKNWRN